MEQKVTAMKLSVRTWKAGDVIELEMPMDVRRIKANDKVEVDRGMVALERGPIMFCLEGKDQLTASYSINLFRMILR